MKMLFRKKNPPLHSYEEISLAAEYLFFKNSILQNLPLIQAYKEWLETELKNPKKYWANFHRVFLSSSQMLTEKMPFYQVDKSKLFVYSDEFRCFCPFDEDSHYFVKYADDTIVDVSKLPEKIYPPYWPDPKKEEDRVELTMHEYCAYFIFQICQEELKKISDLIDFAENPKKFSCKMVSETENNPEREQLWLFAVCYEEHPFEVEKTTSHSRYTTYFF